MSMSLLQTWWSMVKADYDLSEGKPIPDDAIILNFSGAGASCHLTKKQMDDALCGDGAEGENCREAGPGNGLCDQCAVGNYERCRYVSAVQTDHPSLSDAARALVDKLEAIHANPEYQSVWVMSANRGVPYTGPQYTEELKSLKAAIAAQPQDSNKGSENIAFVGQCHPGCHAKPSASMGICHTMFCPVRDGDGAEGDS